MRELNYTEKLARDYLREAVLALEEGRNVDAKLQAQGAIDALTVNEAKEVDRLPGM